MSVKTFDFSTLYTKIPHHLLRDALFEIVEFCFKGGISDGFYVTKAGAFWRNPLKDYSLGVRNFWIIQNNKPVVDHIKKIVVFI